MQNIWKREVRKTNQNSENVLQTTVFLGGNAKAYDTYV
jgi:hypothetical protein